MKNNKLSPEQIEELFAFCRKHFVRHYDLQIELVDHLAAAIEDQISKDDQVTFESALSSTFKNFGIYGFSKVKEQKQKALERKYRNLIIKYTFEYYRLPKLIITIACTLILFTAIRMVHNPFWIIIPYFFALAGSVSYYLFWLYPKRYKINVEKGMSFMILDYLKDKQFVAMFVLQIPIQSIQISYLMDYQLLSNLQLAFIISFLLVTLTIFLYISLFILPDKIREHFKEQFSQFQIA
jgi:hypothetical protein